MTAGLQDFRKTRGNENTTAGLNDFTIKKA